MIVVNSTIMINTDTEANKRGTMYYATLNLDDSRTEFDSKNGQKDSSSRNSDNSLETQKVAVIMFDRGYKTQFTNAKPILDKYDFKGSFFVICSFIDGKGYYELANGTERFTIAEVPMNWDEIIQLQKEGHDIESHGMEHRYLGNLSGPDLEHEVAGSKECLKKQGLNPVFFQFPSNKGEENSTILKMVSKYFDFGLSGHSELMFLYCDGWMNYGFNKKSYKDQYDCRPYFEDGMPTRTNQYSIKEWSHDRYHDKLNDIFTNLAPHGNNISTMMFDEFVRLLGTQVQYNEKAGRIVSIPIVGYHEIGNYTNTYDTSIGLFDREMKYLYENGFKILTLTDLGYDEKDNHFYIK